MKLPQLSQQWSLAELIKNLIEAFRLLEATDKLNRKTNATVELAPGQRLIITGDDDVRYVIEIVAGTLTATPV